MAGKTNINHSISKIIKFASWIVVFILLFFYPLVYGGVLPEFKWSLQALTFLLIILIFLRLFVNPERTWSRTSFDVVSLLYLVLLVVSIEGSIDRYTSIRSFFTYITPLLFFYGLVQLLHRRNNCRKLVILFCFYGFVLSMIGLFQYLQILPNYWWSTKGSIAGTYVNPNHFGGFLEMVIPLALGQVFLGKHMGGRILCGVFALFMIIALLLTKSNGALVSFSCSMIIFFFLLFYPKKAPRLSLIILFLLCIIMVTFIFNRIATISEMTENKTDSVLVGELNSWDARESVWRSTVKMIKDNPLTGVGLGNYELAFPLYRLPKMDKKVDYAHNDFLQFIAEVGLFGVLVILFATYRLFLVTFQRLENPDYPRYYRGIVIGAFSGLISIWFHSLFDFNLQIPANTLIAVFLLALLNLDFYAHRLKQSDNA